MTAYSPGAVGIVQVYGEPVERLLVELTGIADWPVSRVQLADLAGIDRGLVSVLRHDWAQISPHGGVRVVRKLMDHLVGLGAVYEAQPSAEQVYPEARNALEADMLACLAVAPSGRAIDLLLAQPRLWRSWVQRQACGGALIEQAPGILARSDQLDRLVNPPMITVVGRPNVGKSTLTNCLLGRSVSLVADLPGTTRDWVTSLADLDGLAVQWVDTPGFRSSTDTIEQQAIELATTVIQKAHVLIALCDPTSTWPDAAAMSGRVPDIWAINKIDQGGEKGSGNSPTAPLAISAQTGIGLDELQRAVLNHLELDSLSNDELWAFSKPLRTALINEQLDQLEEYVG